jgi:hypothetical protein
VHPMLQIQLVQSNLKALAVWTLGTSSMVGDSDSHTVSIAMRCHNDVWIFDCGDDTQRQLLRVATSEGVSIKFLKITRIFVTSLEGPRVHGIPGFLCMLVRTLLVACANRKPLACRLWQEGQVEANQRQLLPCGPLQLACLHVHTTRLHSPNMAATKPSSPGTSAAEPSKGGFVAQ